jgi:glutamate synthase (NADPH/NADH) small chain
LPTSEKILPADYVFLAMGFTGPEIETFAKGHDLDTDSKGNIARNENFETNLAGIFVCGDAGRGQSLIVWAIAEGRSCAKSVDAFLMGNSQLPAPISPFDRPLILNR